MNQRRLSLSDLPEPDPLLEQALRPGAIRIAADRAGMFRMLAEDYARAHFANLVLVLARYRTSICYLGSVGLTKMPDAERQHLQEMAGHGIVTSPDFLEKSVDKKLTAIDALLVSLCKFTQVSRTQIERVLQAERAQRFPGD